MGVTPTTEHIRPATLRRIIEESNLVETAKRIGKDSLEVVLNAALNEIKKWSRATRERQGLELTRLKTDTRRTEEGHRKELLELSEAADKDEERHKREVERLRKLITRPDGFYAARCIYLINPDEPRPWQPVKVIDNRVTATGTDAEWHVTEWEFGTELRMPDGTASVLA